MGCQPTDCLNDIFEYLEKDKFSLQSCLLVNRLWCEVAVRILWNNPWNFKYNVYFQYRIDNCMNQKTFYIRIEFLFPHLL